jgi:succinate dehydrogenase / fumarate reductase cytochrome b subunit
MRKLCTFFGSSLGKKYVMAVTGAGMFLFAIGHMIGNLQVFLPPEAINRYAHFLQSNLELLWPVRIGLLAIIVLHIWAAAKLSRDNKAARPVPYHGNIKPLDASLASRTMLVTGLIVLVFIVFHLLHYTVRVEAVNGTQIVFGELKTADGHPDVYAMIVAGFSVWYVSLFYMVGVGLLCLHLSHGASSMFQSLGLKNHVYGPFMDKAAKAISIALFVGYASIPAAVLFAGHGKAYLKQVVENTAAIKVASGEVK